MPFHKRPIADLYDAIVTDEVKYRRKLSKIAWNLLTQVSRHIAKENFSVFCSETNNLIDILYIQWELSTVYVGSSWQLLWHASSFFI